MNKNNNLKNKKENEKNMWLRVHLMCDAFGEKLKENVFLFIERELKKKPWEHDI